MPPWAWARSWVSRRVGVGGGLALANHTGDFGNARAVESARSSRRTRRGAKCEGMTRDQQLFNFFIPRRSARARATTISAQRATARTVPVSRCSPSSLSLACPPRARGPRLSFLRPPPRSVFVFAVVFISLVLFQIQKDDPSRPHQHGGESLAPPHRQRRRRDEPGKRAIPRPPPPRPPLAHASPPRPPPARTPAAVPARRTPPPPRTPRTRAPPVTPPDPPSPPPPGRRPPPPPPRASPTTVAAAPTRDRRCTARRPPPPYPPAPRSPTPPRARLGVSRGYPPRVARPRRRRPRENTTSLARRPRSNPRARRAATRARRLRPRPTIPPRTRDSTEETRIWRARDRPASPRTRLSVRRRRATEEEAPSVFRRDARLRRRTPPPPPRREQPRETPRDTPPTFSDGGFLSRDVFVLDLVLVLVLVLFWRVFFRHRHVRGGEFFSERVRGDAVCEKRARERVVRGG